MSDKVTMFYHLTLRMDRVLICSGCGTEFRVPDLHIRADSASVCCNWGVLYNVSYCPFCGKEAEQMPLIERMESQYA
jgi:hypothetical protein